MGHKGPKGQPNRDGSFGANEGCYMGPTMTEGFFWWIIVQNDFFRGICIFCLTSLGTFLGATKHKTEN